MQGSIVVSLIYLELILRENGYTFCNKIGIMICLLIFSCKILLIANLFGFRGKDPSDSILFSELWFC